MINSAKCSGRADTMKMVPDKLYRNCREHGLAELNVLDPDLVVTQGVKAAQLLEGQYKCLDDTDLAQIPMQCDGADVGAWLRAQVKEHFKWWKRKNGRCVLVLQTPHPSARSRQWERFERTMLPMIAHFIRQWSPLRDSFG